MPLFKVCTPLRIIAIEAENKDKAEEMLEEVLQDITEGELIPLASNERASRVYSLDDKQELVYQEVFDDRHLPSIPTKSCVRPGLAAEKTAERFRQLLRSQASVSVGFSLDTPDPEITRERLALLNPEALHPDGLEQGLIGFAWRGDRLVGVYNYQLCIKQLVEDGQSESEESAQEWMDFNVLEQVGENMPYFLLPAEEERDEDDETNPPLDVIVVESANRYNVFSTRIYSVHS